MQLRRSVRVPALSPAASRPWFTFLALGRLPLVGLENCFLDVGFPLGKQQAFLGCVLHQQRDKVPDRVARELGASQAYRRLHHGRIEVREVFLQPVQNAGHGHLLVRAVHGSSIELEVPPDASREANNRETAGELVPALFSSRRRLASLGPWGCAPSIS